MKKYLIPLGLASLAIIGQTVQAEEFLDDRFYVAPFGTYMQPGGNTNGYGGWGAGAGFGKILDEHFNVEVRGFWQNYQSSIGNSLGNRNNNGQTDLTGATVDGQFYFFRDTFSPYVVAAMGGMNTSGPQPWLKSARGASIGSFIFETGVGATVDLLDNLALRADIRYRINTAPTSSGTGSGVLNDMLINVGFVIPFGDKPQPAQLAAAPAPPPVVDDCSSRDSDHDGINDCDDKCPGTLESARVDTRGCPISIELKGINFKYDASDLLPESKKTLDRVAKQLVEYPTNHEIEVVGHTSTEGSDEYNLKLSQRRSQAVADYLKSSGVKNVLRNVGMGESHPLIPHERNEEERAKNRRVQLVWQGEANFKTK